MYCPTCVTVHAVMKEVMHSCRNQWVDGQSKANCPQFWTNAIYFLFLLLFQVKYSYCGEYRRAGSECYYHCGANKQSQRVWLISLGAVLLPFPPSAPSRCCTYPTATPPLPFRYDSPAPIRIGYFWCFNRWERQVKPQQANGKNLKVSTPVGALGMRNSVN